MSVPTQSDSDYRHDSELDEKLPDGQGIGYNGDDVINQDGDDFKLRSTSLLQSPGPNDETYQPPFDWAESKSDIDSAQDSDYHGDENTRYTRPNRWYGADSTWLSWTEDERLVAQSLDRVRSQDLSIHLYNAFALNSSVNSSQQSRRTRSKGKAPIRPNQTGQDDHSGFLITPPGWTAWPLPPEQVPREPLLPQTSHDSLYRLRDDYRLSAPLEECIIATATRIARQRWSARTSLPEFSTKRDWGVKGEDEAADPSVDADIPQANDDEDSTAESELREIGVSGPGSSASESAEEPMFTSQAYDLALDIDEEAKDEKALTGEADSSGDLQPAPIVDDEKARTLLLPGARHMLSKIDDLLMGLHEARQTYATVPLRRKLPLRPHETDVSEVSSDAYHGRGRKRKRTPGRSGSTRSKSTDSGSGNERKDRWRTLQARGWSDVVGMAALTGWNPVVIERASQRCASLFGQNMLFRTFHEGDRAKNQDSYFSEFKALDSEPLDRAMNALSSRRRAGHKTLSKGRLRVDDARSVEANALALHDLPFRNVWYIQRHIDSVHRDDPLPPHRDDASFALPSVESQLLTQSQLFSSQPSHEIICPVTTCPRHKQPFVRAGKQAAR
ncbi:hypothetical protein DV735_g889, partial [Chaetothyriales sp. CBS 134920]